MQTLSSLPTEIPPDQSGKIQQPIHQSANVVLENAADVQESLQETGVPTWIQNLLKQVPNLQVLPEGAATIVATAREKIAGCAEGVLTHADRLTQKVDAAVEALRSQLPANMHDALKKARNVIVISGGALFVGCSKGNPDYAKDLQKITGRPMTAPDDTIVDHGMAWASWGIDQIVAILVLAIIGGIYGKITATGKPSFRDISLNATLFAGGGALAKILAWYWARIDLNSIETGLAGLGIGGIMLLTRLLVNRNR